MVMRHPAPQDKGGAPWYVRCESVEADVVNSGEQAKGAKPKGWVYAQSPGGVDIQILGRLEDGFVHVEDVLSTDPDWRFNWDAPYEHMRSVCLETLVQKKKSDRFQLGLVRATQPGNKIYTSFVFQDRPEIGPVERLVVFGDSLSDTGNLRRRLKVFPSRPYWLGRFSNGPVWVDYLEVWAKLAVQNHAYGGALTTLSDRMADQQVKQRISAQGQFFVSGSVEHQLESYRNRFLSGERLAAVEETTVVHWSGANDYMSKEPFTGAISTLLKNPSSDQGYLETVKKVVNATEAQLRLLENLGVKKIILINLPNLGSTPMVLHNDSYTASQADTSDVGRRIEFAQRLRVLTQWHNIELARMAQRLNVEFPNLELLLLDVFSMLDEFLGSEFPGEPDFDAGFDLEPTSIELTQGVQEAFVQERCYSGSYLGMRGASSTICENAPRAMFWDQVHPTTYLHCWQAYIVGRAMNAEGWSTGLPDQTVYRQWCQRIADAY
jgi:phospholipase/lecithinase/hemolysin